MFGTGHRAEHGGILVESHDALEPVDVRPYVWIIRSLVGRGLGSRSGARPESGNGQHLPIPIF